MDYDAIDRAASQYVAACNVAPDVTLFLTEDGWASPDFALARVFRDATDAARTIVRLEFDGLLPARGRTVSEWIPMPAIMWRREDA